MSDLEQRDGSDIAVKPAPPEAVSAEAVITDRNQQSTLSTKNDSTTYPLSNIDLVESKITEGSEADRKSLRLSDFTSDPLERGIGNLVQQFDSLTDKMSTMLGKPEIKADSRFSLQSLKDTLYHPELAKQFSEKEIQSLRLMANQARRLVDPESFKGLAFESFQSPNPPVDKLYISKESVINAGKKLRVISEA